MKALSTFQGGTKIGSMNQNVSAEVCSLFDYVLQVFSELSAIEAETDRINSEIARRRPAMLTRSLSKGSMR